MSLKIRFSRAIAAAALVASFSIAGLGDTIRLKDGSIIKGRIVSFADGKFTVTVGEGERKRQMSYDAAEIDQILFDPAQAQPVTNRNASAINREPVDTYKSAVSEKPAITPPVNTNPAPVRTSTNPGIKPVALSVKVLADNTSNGWTNSGWVVKAGQRIRISGSGDVSIGGGKRTSPSGLYDHEDGTKLLKNVPTGALIAVIGDDNNDFIYIGADREFVATRDGALFLGLNEGKLDDNSGSFDVKIEIFPG